MTSYIPDVVPIIDNNNSTTTNLIANGVFTGTSRDCTLYSSITVSVFSNQASSNVGLELQFSPDNTNWVTSENFVVSANRVKTVITNPFYNFFRVRYTNGTTIQSSFRLQTLLSPSQPFNSRQISDSLNYSKTSCQISNGVINALTKTINPTDSTKTLVESLSTDNRGNLNIAPVSSNSFNDLRLIKPTPITQIDFVYGTGTPVSNNYYNISLNNGGTATFANSMLNLTANALIPGGNSVNFESKKSLKVKHGQGWMIRFSAIFPLPPVSGNFQRIGAGIGSGAETEIVGFGVNITGFIIIYLRKNGPAQSINQSNWNIDKMDGSSPSGNILDPTKGNSYQIVRDSTFGNVFFYVMVGGSINNWVLVHVINNSNLPIPTSPLFTTSELKISAFNESIETTLSSRTLSIASASIFVEGEENFLGGVYTTKFIRTTATIANTEFLFFAIRNDTLFNNITNYGKIKLLHLSTGTRATNTITTVRLSIGNITGGSFTPIDTGNSIISVTNGGAFTISRRVFGVNCGLNSSSNVDLSSLEIFLLPGQILICTGLTPAAVTGVSASLTWVEDI